MQIIISVFRSPNINLLSIVIQVRFLSKSFIILEINFFEESIL